MIFYHNFFIIFFLYIFLKKDYLCAAWLLSHFSKMKHFLISARLSMQNRTPIFFHMLVSWYKKLPMYVSFECWACTNENISMFWMLACNNEFWLAIYFSSCFLDIIDIFFHMNVFLDISTYFIHILNYIENVLKFILCPKICPKYLDIHLEKKIAQSKLIIVPTFKIQLVQYLLM